MGGVAAVPDPGHRAVAAAVVTVVRIGGHHVDRVTGSSPQSVATAVLLVVRTVGLLFHVLLLVRNPVLALSWLIEKPAPPPWRPRRACLHLPLGMGHPRVLDTQIRVKATEEAARAAVAGRQQAPIASAAAAAYATDNAAAAAANDPDTAAADTHQTARCGDGDTVLPFILHHHLFSYRSAEGDGGAHDGCHGCTVGKVYRRLGGFNGTDGAGGGSDRAVPAVPLVVIECGRRSGSRSRNGPPIAAATHTAVTHRRGHSARRSCSVVTQRAHLCAVAVERAVIIRFETLIDVGCDHQRSRRRGSVRHWPCAPNTAAADLGGAHGEKTSSSLHSSLVAAAATAATAAAIANLRGDHCPILLPRDPGLARPPVGAAVFPRHWPTPQATGRAGWPAGLVSVAVPLGSDPVKCTAATAVAAAATAAVC